MIPPVKVVVMPPLAQLPPAGLAGQLPGWEVVLPDDPARARAELATADAVIAQLLSHADAASAARLRLCQVFAAGWDAIAADALPPGCTVCNSAGHETALGEHVLGVTLMLSRRLGLRDRALRAGRWDQGLGAPFDSDLAGRTAGLIGLGTIGLRCAELFRALGMRTAAVCGSPSPERAAAAGLEWLGGPSRDDLHELLRCSDVAVVAVPREAATEGLIGAAELDALGPGGILVHVARGPVVHERALYEALRDGRLGGAAIDVWWRYPREGEQEFRPSHEPFHELDNVVMTPHTAGLAQSNFASRWAFAVEQLRALAEGRPLQRVVVAPREGAA